jgi:hypothetical protein
MVDSVTAMELSGLQDCTATDGGLLRFARSCAFAFLIKPRVNGVHTDCLFLLDLPVRAALDPARPEAALPGLPGQAAHPARVGEPSRNFLGWNGLELICIAGHGLLHVPEIQTSWFSTQRWLYLDPSWDVLFVEAGAASSGYV